MQVRCWGSRGSIPVSGQEYLKYGGDTTCIEIRSEDTTIIVDAGTGIRRLGNDLIQSGRLSCDLIFTHAHWDHLMGFPFFKPLYRKEAELRIHGYPFAVGFIEEMLSKIMSAPNFPVSYTDIKASIQYIHGCPEQFDIRPLTVVPIALSHPNQGNGYKFIENGKVFVFLTDNELEYLHPGGCGFNHYVEFTKGADLLIHDAEYTDEELQQYRTWGHSSYRSALSLAIQAGVKRLGLFHLNQDRSDSDMDRLVRDCRKIIAAENSDLECSAVGCDMVMDL